MPTSRYTFNSKINNQFVPTSDLSSKIFYAVDSGTIASTITQVNDHERLDHIAYKTYGDGTLWWIIAAASGLGWSMQLSGGTYIRIPTDLQKIYSLMKTNL